MNNPRPPPSTPLAITASKQNLLRLCMIRSIVLLGQWLTIIYAFSFLSMGLRYPHIIITLSILTLLTLATYLRSRQAWPILEAELFIHLLLDIIGLSVLLYYTGGATNPFISYYLIPISISAAVLPWAYTWSLTGLCILLYSAMLYYYIPIPALEPNFGHQTGNHAAALNFHVIGMWANFSISAVLITYFVVKMAQALRLQEQHIHHSQQQLRQNEQLISVAALAAGTTHELGTPLSTMAVLLSELEDEYQSNKPLRADITVLRQQVESCKSILQTLRDTAERNQGNLYECLPVDRYIKNLISQWSVMRPQIKINLNSTQSSNAALICAPPILNQAIINLLNNAADAGLETGCKQIDLMLDWDDQKILLTIRDYGPGISPHIMENIGKPFLTTKGKGLGLGLFLSHTTITKLGGTIKLYNHETNGSIAQISFPISP